jgi:toxin YoeB
MYRIELTDDAVRDSKTLRKSDSKAFKKLSSLIEELKLHPKTGTGHPEPLKGDRAGQWSRRITGKHRLVYKIEDEVLIVIVLTAYNHYGDK